MIDYSVLLLNTVVREGVILYINNAEITRYNMDFNLHGDKGVQEKNDSLVPHYSYNDATYIFRYARYTTASFSHLYLHQGVNTIAVEIHRHLLSKPRIRFALNFMLLSSSEFHYYSSFPLVSSSVHVGVWWWYDEQCDNAFYIFNSPYVSSHTWNATRDDYILYEHAGYNYHHINTIAITRGEDCVPHSFEFFGVLMYYDAYGIARESSFSLLNSTALDWGTRFTLSIPLASLKTSYHAFMLRARCMH